MQSSVTLETGRRSVDVLTPGAGTVPLVIDVDGVLHRSSLAWEAAARIAFDTPGRLPAIVGAALRGRRALRAALAEGVREGLETVPANPAVLRLIATARAAGQPVVLTGRTSAPWLPTIAQALEVDALLPIEDLAVRARADERIDAPADAAAGDPARARLRAIEARWPVFDYAATVGDPQASGALWTRARRAIALDARRRARAALRPIRPDHETVTVPRAGLRPLWKALRPHQWAKNLLLFLPAITAHSRPTAGLALALILGFVAFSAVASAIYLLNDLADLPADRRHPRKRHRPLAAGTLQIPVALAAVAALGALGGGIAAVLPGRFAWVLAGYAALSVAYSFTLKRRLLVDVITLAVLYTVRVIAGAAIPEVPLSNWFVAFSVFFFFALAVAKRVIELRARGSAVASALVLAGAGTHVPGRAYRGGDDLPLIVLGGGATAANSLVFCLWVASEDVAGAYAHPDLLWVGLPLLLYWQARIWIFAARGSLDEDPVAFALRDRVSWLVGAALVLSMVVAR